MIHSSLCSKSSPTKFAEVGVTRVCPKDRTFVEILLAKPRSRVEAKNGGVDQGVRWIVIWLGL